MYGSRGGMHGNKIDRNKEHTCSGKRIVNMRWQDQEGEGVGQAVPEPPRAVLLFVRGAEPARASSSGLVSTERPRYVRVLGDR